MFTIPMAERHLGLNNQQVPVVSEDVPLPQLGMIGVLNLLRWRTFGMIVLSYS
jgi:hypothetical protein